MLLAGPDCSFDVTPALCVSRSKRHWVNIRQSQKTYVSALVFMIIHVYAETAFLDFHCEAFFAA